MQVLIACEESQAITIAMRDLGIEAYSCDIQDCSGGKPEWHIKGDCIDEAYSGKYDLMIAHPPCTYLSNSGVCWLYKKRGRIMDMIEGSFFFKKLLDAPIKYIAIENPIMHRYAVRLVGRKHDQLIQPYHFGHKEQKATCFWLKNLPRLVHTSDLRKETLALPIQKRQRLHWQGRNPERGKIRSKTFAGVAKAIADQWGKYVMNEVDSRKKKKMSTIKKLRQRGFYFMKWSRDDEE